MTIIMRGDAETIISLPSFTILIHESAEGETGYWGEVIELPGCVSQGGDDCRTASKRTGSDRGDLFRDQHSRQHSLQLRHLVINGDRDGLAPYECRICIPLRLCQLQ